MEAIGAVASIVQIAQLGAQLSITLYNISETIGSAHKDVQYVAKDIALFSAVLKDLGKTLERGEKSRLYRDAAYESSRLIVKECEAVFGEIEDVLGRSSRDGVLQGTHVSLSKVDKFMWIFRKSRVHLLRGNLESLKSTILLQLAVLGYADKVSKSSNDVDATDEILTLKSLVLAEGIAKRQFEDMLTHDPRCASTQSLSNTSSNRAGTVRNSGKSRSLWHDDPFISSMVHPSEARLVTPRSPEQSKHTWPKSRIHKTIPVNQYELTTKNAEVWGALDRLELAVRKVDTAKWEHDRIQENLRFGIKDASDDRHQQVEEFCLQRLEQDLLSFGLSREKASQALASLQTHHVGAGLRTEVKHLVPNDDMLIETLQALGASWEIDEENTSCCAITRWMPEFFDDILWGHTYKILLDFPGPQLSSDQGGSRISVGMRDPEIDYSFSKQDGDEYVESRRKLFRDNSPPRDEDSHRDKDDGRRLGQPFRSTNGRDGRIPVHPNAYDPYYPQPRTSRESIPGPRTSVERVTPPRIVPRSNRDDPLVVRRAHDDYVVSPRRSAFDPLPPATRKPLGVIASGSTTSSTNRIQPIISTASDKPASPFGKSRTRDDEPYFIQPAVSTRRDHNRHYSADSWDIDRLITASRDGRDRTERGGHRSSGIAGGRGAYNLNAPLVRQPKDEDDREYSYVYKDKTENMHRDNAQRPRRRESVPERKERPLSMNGIDDYLPKPSSSTRDTGPPVTNRGFNKINKLAVQYYECNISFPRSESEAASISDEKRRERGRQKKREKEMSEREREKGVLEREWEKGIIPRSSYPVGKPLRSRGADDITSEKFEATPGISNPVEDLKSAAEDAYEGLKGPTDAAKASADDAKEEAEDIAGETSGKIGLQDNDPNEADDEDTDTPQGKISQGGNETHGDEKSVTMEKLDQATPEKRTLRSKSAVISSQISGISSGEANTGPLPDTIELLVTKSSVEVPLSNPPNRSKGITLRQFRESTAAQSSRTSTSGGGGSTTKRSILHKMRRYRNEKPSTDGLGAWDAPNSWACIKADNDAIREERALRIDIINHATTTQASKTIRTSIPKPVITNSMGTADVDAAVDRNLNKYRTHDTVETAPKDQAGNRLTDGTISKPHSRDSLPMYAELKTEPEPDTTTQKVNELLRKWTFLEGLVEGHGSRQC